MWFAMSHSKFGQSQQLNGYNQKVSSKEPMSCFPWSHVWPCSLCYDWCHIKLIELSAQRVRGQTHPVRNILVVSQKEGLGGFDLLIVWGMMDWEGEQGGVCSVRLSWTMKKISGDKRWLRVAGQFCHHLMLFSKTGEENWRLKTRKRE